MIKALPWRRWLQIALGILEWSPATFWGSTYTEFVAAVEGYKEKHNLREVEPMTEEELYEMMERFPDKKNGRTRKDNRNNRSRRNRV